jgi:hypothetical protein
VGAVFRVKSPGFVARRNLTHLVRPAQETNVVKIEAFDQRGLGAGGTAHLGLNKHTRNPVGKPFFNYSFGACVVEQVKAVCLVENALLLILPVRSCLTLLRSHCLYTGLILMQNKNTRTFVSSKQGTPHVGSRKRHVDDASR